MHAKKIQSTLINLLLSAHVEIIPFVHIVAHGGVVCARVFVLVCVGSICSIVPHGIVVLHMPYLRWCVPSDLLVNQVLDTPQFLGGNRLVVRKVEAQAIRCDQRTLLLYVLAKDASQRCMHEMGSGMIEDDSRTTFTIDTGAYLVAFG